MDVVIKKKRIKRMYLRVSPKDGSVNISAPIGMPDRIIKDFIEKNINWIRERQAQILLDKKNAEKPLSTGTAIYFWGREYNLIVRQAFSNAVIPRNDDILVYVKKDSSAEGVLDKWLRNKLKEEIAERSITWENIVGKHASEYAVRKMTRCWGNCRPKTGRIALNFELVHKPKECLDYVLVHELVHFYEIYHNKKFWSLVEKFYPNWKQVKYILK